MGSIDWCEIEIDSPSGSIAAMDWGGAGDPLLLLHGGNGDGDGPATTPPTWRGSPNGSPRESPSPTPGALTCGGPTARYHAVPSAEVIAALHNLGLRPENPFARIENYADVRCPVLLLCGTHGLAAGLGREDPGAVAVHIRRFLSELDASTRA